MAGYRLPRMPIAYAAPGSRARRIPPYYSYCHVFTGKGTAFEDPEGEALNGFTDGVSNTLLLVEAGEAVSWTKAQELLYAADKPFPNLDGPFHDCFRAAFADGSVDYIKKETEESRLRAVITRNGGEAFVVDW